MFYSPLLSRGVACDKSLSFRKISTTAFGAEEGREVVVGQEAVAGRKGKVRRKVVLGGK